MSEPSNHRPPIIFKMRSPAAAAAPATLQRIYQQGSCHSQSPRPSDGRPEVTMEALEAVSPQYHSFSPGHSPFGGPSSPAVTSTWDSHPHFYNPTYYHQDVRMTAVNPRDHVVSHPQMYPQYYASSFLTPDLPDDDFSRHGRSARSRAQAVTDSQGSAFYSRGVQMEDARPTSFRGNEVLLAAVRDGFMGGMFHESSPKTCIVSTGGSSKPTVPIAPLGGVPSAPGGSNDGSRLPSIGNYFGNVSSSSQTRSPFANSLESLVGKYPRVAVSKGQASLFTGPTSTLGHEERVAVPEAPKICTPVSSIKVTEAVKMASRHASSENCRKRSKKCLVKPVEVNPVVVTHAPDTADQSKLRSSVEIVDSPSMHCHHPSIAVSASGPVKTENPLCRDMPSPLPVTSASVSPVPTLQTSSIDEPVSEGSLNESIESIPPPLQIGTTGEPDVPPRQSLRLRIKLTKSGGTAVETVRPSVIKITGKDVDGNLVCSTLSIQDNSSGIVRVRSAPEVTEVRPSRVKKRHPDKTTPNKKMDCKRKVPSLKSKAKSKPPAACFSDWEAREIEKLAQGDVDVTSANSILATARLEKLDFRAKFDMMPPAIQYEIMALMPECYKTTDPQGCMTLLPGILGKNDTKFRQHLNEWQASLHAGEYDTEVRKKYIEYAVGNIDPWKVENFEPCYGEIMSRPVTTGDDGVISTSARIPTDLATGAPEPESR